VVLAFQDQGLETVPAQPLKEHAAVIKSPEEITCMIHACTVELQFHSYGMCLSQIHRTDAERSKERCERSFRKGDRLFATRGDIEVMRNPQHHRHRGRD